MKLSYNRKSKAGGEGGQPLRKIFWNRPNVRFHLSEIRGLDLSAKVVKIAPHEIHYDYLVIALGSQPNFYGIPGAAEYAFTLKSLEQGVILRGQILTCFERAACEADAESRQDWLTFIIVGGGPTGVEVRLNSPGPGIISSPNTASG